ncbi:MAG: response regulator transcription factor [Ruminococcaceae bacterium]|nr:response regulator transcription factor [Oscillospiraceae bacterium]
MEKIKVIMCDDQQSICDCYRYVFEMTEDILLLGTANNKADSKKLILGNQADVILLDIQMDTAETGLELIPFVQEYQPQAKIMMLTVHEEPEYIFRAFQEGISDYFVKTLPAEELVRSIRAVYENQVVLRPGIAQKIVEQTNEIMRKQKLLEAENEEVKNNQKSLLYILNLMTKLSNSEFEILKGLYYGKSCAQIAEERYVSESTVRTHTGRILKKFEYSSMKKLILQLRKINAFSMFDE